MLEFECLLKNLYEKMKHKYKDRYITKLML